MKTLFITISLILALTQTINCEEVKWGYSESIEDRAFDIDFFDDEFGVIVGNKGAIFVSHNRGENWNKTIIEFNKVDYFISVQVVNKNTAYVITASGDIVKTTDSGENWNIIPFKNNSEEFHSNQHISFIDENIGIVARFEKLYKTEDGGENWSEIFESEDKIHGIHLFDKENALIVNSNGERNQIIKTSDGGDSWVNTDSTSFGDFGKNLFVLNNSILFIGSSSEYLLYSENKGDSWSKYNINVQINSITSMYFTSYEKGWIADYNGKIISTETGEGNWNFEHQITQGTKRHYVTDFHLFDDGSGYSIVEAVLFERQLISTNVSNNKLESENIFPNPASEKLYLKFERPVSKIQIFNNLGSLVLNKETDRISNIELDISNLNPGFYLLKVIDNNSVIKTKKFIVTE